MKRTPRLPVRSRAPTDYEDTLAWTDCALVEEHARVEAPMFIGELMSESPQQPVSKGMP